MTRRIESASASFIGASGNRLAADVFGESGPAVLLLHGGGQTRHAWRRTAERLARAGLIAYALDLRGHGDSEWVTDGRYGFAEFAGDAAAVARALTARTGERPVAVGASLGGMAALVAEGDAEANGASLFSALVLVDITPRVDRGGVAKIQGFMRAHATEGFGSVAEAAEAVAAYLPHRPRPRSHEGLKKNLRLHPDGRWRWHWDPRFLDGGRGAGVPRDQVEALMTQSARRIRAPALLVRGASSELVQERHVREFLELVPHAEYVDVAGARHMVAGDNNDRFSAAILDFLGRLRPDDRGRTTDDRAGGAPR
jgi:pimeloyl-ACP methyl ester carboxylesterase